MVLESLTFSILLIVFKEKKKKENGDLDYGFRELDLFYLAALAH